MVSIVTKASKGGLLTAVEMDANLNNLNAGKQDLLVSGENLKTINGESMLGNGNLEVVGGLIPTSIKTSAYTAVVNDLVRVDSTSAAFTVTVPAAPVDGDKIGVLDTAAMCGTNAVLLAAAGGKNVGGDPVGLSLNISGTYITLLYNAATSNWVVQQTPLAGAYQPILVSGTNIKTVNGGSLLGSGNLVINSGYSGADGLVLEYVGNAAIFEAAATNYISVTMLDATKALVVYRDDGNSNYGTACVLSVSGTVITAGTPVVFEAAATNYISVTMLDATKALVVYRDNGNSGYGTACVLSISGTVITTGTPVVFEAANTYYTSVTMLDATKALVVYRDGNSSYGTACVLSISGTVITTGTPVVFETATTYYTSVTMLDSTKALVVYQDAGNSNYGTACVLSISGTVITAGTPVVFEAAATHYISVTMLDATKALVVYRDDGNSSYGTACVLSISGTGITAGTPVVFESAATYYTSVTMLDSTKALVTYCDAGNSDYGTARILQPLLTHQLHPTDSQLQRVKTDGNNWTLRLPDPSTMVEGAFPFVIMCQAPALKLANSDGLFLAELTYNSFGLTVLQSVSDNLWSILTSTSKNTSIVAGLPSVFEAAATSYTSVTMLDSTKALVVYQDAGNSSYGTACVLSISGTVITAGTPVVFESATTNYISVTMLDATKALVAYRDNGNSGYGTACVLSISGTVITAGTPVVFEAADTYYISVTMLDSTKALVTYCDAGNSSYGTACFLSISGTVITAGTPVVFESAATYYISVTMLDSTKALVVYRDDGNSSYGTACVLSISGTVITAGTPVVFETATTYFTSVTMLDSTKALVTYCDAGNSSYGTACVLSISGTVITAGTPVVFESAATSYTSVTMLDSTKALVVYRDNGNSGYGTACVLSVSGTVITAGTPVVFEAAITYYISVTMLDSTKALVVYQDAGNSDYGTACVLSDIL